MSNIPLAVLDLVPISSGSTAAEALRNSIDLARAAEHFGYARYWFAEHHLNPGVAGTSPAVVLALTAAATSTIRIGSGAVQMGHRTALSVVEEFGLIDVLHPGRLDLGLGRSGGRPPQRNPKPALAGAPRAVNGRAPNPPRGDGPAPEAREARQGRPPARGQASRATPRRGASSASNGLLIPPRFNPEHLLGSPRFQMQKTLLQLPGAQPQDYGEQVGDVLALLRGTYRSADGIEAHVIPGEGADVQVWILGSSGGQSAQVAGANGLRFAANYHVSPGTVLEASEGYRAAFRPSADLSRPYVSVSADVVVAPDDATARELAAGYGPWVRSIRSGEGAIAFPAPQEARAHSWTDADRALVADRVDTQFVGSPGQVADQLEQLQEATGADELIITTITHSHADRVRSYQLLAEEWHRR
jgi:alkanesulfonate monooxygenase SsuD/methylene tetrahydromethanopterin reductase-like flavin-dependent oxidoreductase (luciferase family)